MNKFNRTKKLVMTAVVLAVVNTTKGEVFAID